MHWDSVNAALQLSSRNFTVHNGILRHGATEIRFDVTAGLVRSHFTDQSKFTTRLETRKTDLGAILAVAGYDYPVSGTIDLEFHADGTRADPRGAGEIQLTNATLYGQPIQHFTSDMRLLNGEIQFNNISAAHYDARIAGAFAYNLSTGVSRFNLQGTNFDLARIPQLQASRFKVEGRVDFSAQGSGTLRQPAINATVRLRDLTLDDELAGDFTLEAVTQGDQLRLAGQSRFEQAELRLDGDILLRDDWPATLNFRFNRLDVDSLLRAYLQGRITGHSMTAGDLQVRGPLRRPRELTVSANLTDLALDVEGVELHNDGPVRFVLSNQLLRLEPFRLTAEQTDLTGSGTVHLAGERELDVRIQGRLNLRLIESFNRDFASSGMVTLDMTVAGTVVRPTAQGKLQISNGTLSYVDLPSGLSEMNGSLSFNHDRVQIDTLTARSGGGAVVLGGYATLHDRRLTFDVTIHGEGVRLRYPPGISSTADADLRFAGSSEASTLSGDITVKKLSMTPGFDFGAYLARSAQSTTLPQTNPL
ncbi:MAG TPA: translocation/assembly module TamB domain-containing protein, partial [Terriglobales bacterium]